MLGTPFASVCTILALNWVPQSDYHKISQITLLNLASDFEHHPLSLFITQTGDNHNSHHKIHSFYQMCTRFCSHNILNHSEYNNFVLYNTQAFLIYVHACTSRKTQWLGVQYHVSVWLSTVVQFVLCFSALICCLTLLHSERWLLLLQSNTNTCKASGLVTRAPPTHCLYADMLLLFYLH